MGEVGRIFSPFFQISNIVAAANSQKMAFRRRWDHLKECMRIWKIPAEVRPLPCPI